MKHLKFMLAKIFRRIIPPALRDCDIDRTSVVLSSSNLTRVTMGRYSYCGYGCTIVNTEIGAFCSIADGVVIGRAEHPMNFVSMSPVFHEGRNVLRKSFSQHSLPEGKITTIGNDVWIGQGVLIKAGVTIGNGAVLGMGTIVTRDVMPYSIVVGNPARELRKRFDEDTIRKLEQSTWWDWPAEELAERAVEFNNVQRFLSKEERR